jgi:hypothetical protein
MAEILAAGYTQLRTGSPVIDWFIEFRDDENNPVPVDDLDSGTVNRLSAAAEERATARRKTSTTSLHYG